MHEYSADDATSLSTLCYAEKQHTHTIIHSANVVTAEKDMSNQLAAVNY